MGILSGEAIKDIEGDLAGVGGVTVTMGTVKAEDAISTIEDAFDAFIAAVDEEYVTDWQEEHLNSLLLTLV